MLLLGNLLKVVRIGQIEININIGDKQLILEIYDVALVPGAIISLFLKDQLKREGIELIGNKLIMGQQIIAEWDLYHGLKSIRMVNMKPYEDLQYKLI